MVRLLTAGATDVGRRPNNEDAYLINQELGLLALSDGMGGAASGEIASSCFIDTAREIFERQDHETDHVLCGMVQEVFSRANSRILDHVMENPNDHGMGCTGELLAFHNEQYIIGHIGDSRIYLFRNGRLRQITKDHSLVQSQVDVGMLSPEEAKNHPRKNIILRALGIDSALQLDVIKGNVRDQDTFLICSDGLTDVVEDEKIREILSSRIAIDRMALSLIKSALSAGSKDNITVLLCQLNNL
jgi:protein phosphatase